MDGIVHYNYALMSGISGALNQCAQTAQVLLTAGQANRATLRGSFEGQTALTFDDSFHKYEQVNQHVIDIANKGVHSYDQGTQGMQTNEHQMMGWFPG